MLLNIKNKCPKCGYSFDPFKFAVPMEHNGKHFYFEARYKYERYFSGGNDPYWWRDTELKTNKLEKWSYQNEDLS